MLSLGGEKWEKQRTRKLPSKVKQSKATARGSVLLFFFPPFAQCSFIHGRAVVRFALFQPIHYYIEEPFMIYLFQEKTCTLNGALTQQETLFIVQYTNARAR